MLRWTYAVVLFAIGAGWALGAASATAEWPPLPVLLGWVGFNLFVWHWGIPTRALGLVSLERFAQVGALLAFGGPVAACINATGSLIWPFTNRGYRKDSLVYGLRRALHNAGMTATMTLVGGWVYEVLGGAVPLYTLDLGALLPLLGLALAMQAMNNLWMFLFWHLEGGDLRAMLTRGYLFGDLLFVPGGVLIAALYHDAPAPVFLLFVVLLVLVVLGANEVAGARATLEARVAERTEALSRALHERDGLVARLEQLTKEDPLTKLANRRQLDERLEEEVARTVRYGHPLTVALADLDHFKRVNDELGHAVGDEVLRLAAALLKRHCRAMDVIARYGGEEFALLFPETDVADARLVCEKIRAAFHGFPWHETHPALRGRVTVSIGVFAHQPGMDGAGLLERADRNLYAAKDGGRDRVEG
jgi:diguanylate cyclase (GGDEF)-like protein